MALASKEPRQRPWTSSRSGSRRNAPTANRFRSKPNRSSLASKSTMPYSAREVLAKLLRGGFSETRQSGSHAAPSRWAADLRGHASGRHSGGNVAQDPQAGGVDTGRVQESLSAPP